MSNLPAKFQPVKVVPSAYSLFKQWHYLDRNVSCPCATFMIPPQVAIIQFNYPCLSSRLRREATNGRFSIGSRRDIAMRLNANVRNVARLVVNPKYRGQHIATNLIRWSLERLNMPFVECYTNLFGASKCFTNAGMSRYLGKPSKLWFEVAAIYKMIGFPKIENLNFWHQRIFFEHLEKAHEKQLRKTFTLFLNSCHRYLVNPTNYELHKEVMERRAQVPVYYYWFNPNRAISEDFEHDNRNEERRPEIGRE
jgi:hypothetical protein